ncbi:MAG: NADPH:quinone reductase [Candidatus Sumerlaeota bacterium]|nr:NADPH:quinone reductase [Candidatus Sumerlaeota bacterium]
MKAWLLDNQTGLGALHLVEDHPKPEAAAGEAVVKVTFAALNPADYYLAQKQYPAKPTFPHILGRDGVGVVESVGEGTTGVQPGDAVTVLRGGTGVSRAGTLAEYVAVPADELVPRPTTWTEEESAGVALVYLTAYQALTQWGPLEPGSTVLVTGGTGGVGIASIQLATALGCRVVALSRSAEKGAKLTGLGAGLVLNPEDPELVAKVKDFAGKGRVAVAVDSVAGKLFPLLVATLGERGSISCVGRLAGPVPEFNTGTIFFRRNRIGGVSAGSYTAAEARTTWAEILRLMEKTGARPLVDSVHPFAEVQAAFARLKEGPLGKVLVRVA